jgi:cob(I)alamin adenosyltransferase
MNTSTHSGLLHLYTGDGKGKTTAALGVTVRAAGGECSIIFAQFLKSSPTGELISLLALDIPVLRSQKHFTFTFQMDDATKDLCATEQRCILDAVAKRIMVGDKDRAATGHKSTPQSTDAGPRRLVVLDEVLDALELGLLSGDALRIFIDNVPSATELILTGRRAPTWLINRADYHTEFCKLKHPYDQGIPARPLIEF